MGRPRSFIGVNIAFGIDHRQAVLPDSVHRFDPLQRFGHRIGPGRNVVGHLGLLHDWTPWIAASVPSVVYLLLSMSAFAWLVRYR